MRQAATLKKISIQLHLSISTVSRALKNHPDISENTKRKVKELAALMEYEPNSYAVNLRTNKSRVLGLIVPFISNLFYESFISAVERDAREMGYSVIILQSGNSPDREQENLKFCKQHRVDGILISVTPESNSGELFLKYQQAGIPIIFFDNVPEYTTFNTVCVADEEAATMAAHTILKYKKKNILALFGNANLSITKKRKKTFCEIIKKENTAVGISIHYCANTEEARQATDKALSASPHPDHIFCMSDEILIGAIKSLNKSGLRVPRDISVLTISNGLIPGLFNPEITYIETSGFELGKLAIKIMFESLEGNNSIKSFIVPARLVEGSSM